MPDLEGLHIWLHAKKTTVHDWGKAATKSFAALILGDAFFARMVRL